MTDWQQSAIMHMFMSKQIAPNLPPQPEEHRLRRALAAVTLVAAGLVGMHGATHDVQPHQEVSATDPAYCPPESDLTLTAVPAEKWAKGFSADPEAGVLTDPTSPATVAQEIKEDAHGRKVENITLIGSASAEDDSVDISGHRTAGLDTPNPKNIDLAQERAETLEPQLEDELAAEGINDVPTEYGEPIEDALDPPEMQTITDMAKQFGYKDLVSMVEQYNRTPEKSPPDVVEYLDKTLKAERNVRVVVHYGPEGASLVCQTIPTEQPPKVPASPHHGKSPRMIPFIDVLPPAKPPEVEPSPPEPPLTPNGQPYPPTPRVKRVPKPTAPQPPQPTVVELRRGLRKADQLQEPKGRAGYPAVRRKQPTKENRSYMGSAHASPRHGGRSVHQNRRGRGRG